MRDDSHAHDVVSAQAGRRGEVVRDAAMRKIIITGLVPVIHVLLAMLK